MSGENAFETKFRAFSEHLPFLVNVTMSSFLLIVATVYAAAASAWALRTWAKERPGSASRRASFEAGAIIVPSS